VVSASATIGARFRALRKERGFSRRTVTRGTGFTTFELAKVERGRRRLTLDDCRSLAGCLGVHPAELAPDDVDLATVALADSHEAQIDALLDQPAPAPTLTLETYVAAAPPIELSDRERRRDLTTRERVEQSWKLVAREMQDVREAARRLAGATSSDDAEELVREAAEALARLSRDHGFRRHAARHQRLLLRSRRRVAQK
jgi:transcriptional regulator with XRE-family HTH domain